MLVINNIHAFVKLITVHVDNVLFKFNMQLTNDVFTHHFLAEMSETKVY